MTCKLFQDLKEGTQSAPRSSVVMLQVPGPKPKSKHLRLLAPDPTRYSRLFNLPLELRHMVYDLLLPTESPIAISAWPHSCYDAYHFEVAYHQGQTETIMGGQELQVDAKFQPVDLNLFMVCRPICDEVLDFLLRKNIVVVDGLKVMQDFICEFPHHAQYISRLVLDISSVLGDVLEPVMHQRLRMLAERCLNLRCLFIRGHIVSVARNGPSIHKQGVVNFFRPLALLPLQRARVSLFASDQRIPLAALKQIEQMCETELLRPKPTGQRDAA